MKNDNHVCEVFYNSKRAYQCGRLECLRVYDTRAEACDCNHKKEVESLPKQIKENLDLSHSLRNDPELSAYHKDVANWISEE